MKKELSKVLEVMNNILPWFVFPSVSFYLMETFHHNPFANMNNGIQLLNIILFVVLAALLYAITGSRRWTFIVESFAAFIIGLANYYVIEFRGTPILPWDIYSVKTAAGVSADYSFALEPKAIASIAAFIVLIILESIWKWNGSSQQKKMWHVRLAAAVVSIAVLCGQYQILQKPEFLSKMRIYDKLYTPYTMIKRDGIALAFMLELQYMEVEKPAEYNSREAAKMYASMEKDNAAVSEQMEKKPNIIVMMNEAFSDPAVLGDFRTNEDYMPVLHNLQQGQENTITGMMNVSIMGGNTANTEFEFLTGFTMAFLPDGSVPYQQYINQPTDSMAAYLKKQGYTTIAMHPYNADGWERNVAYPYMGFDTFYSLKNFYGASKVREYIDDESCVDRIIREYEKSTEPCFLFNVTMQNHSPYTAEYDNFTPDITVEGSESFQLSTYLSLIKRSDAALGRLIEYFAEAEEDTIIVFFGDHQPTDSVVKDVWTLNGVDPDNLTEEQACLRYQVPFVVWANYDIEEHTDIMTSANFLGAQTFDWCGLSKSGYQNYLLGISEEYTSITARAVFNNEQKLVDFQEVKDDLLQYNMLQYYRLFN